jgi:hypothetical protein
MFSRTCIANRTYTRPYAQMFQDYMYWTTNHQWWRSHTSEAIQKQKFDIFRAWGCNSLIIVLSYYQAFLLREFTSYRSTWRSHLTQIEKMISRPKNIKKENKVEKLLYMWTDGRADRWNADLRKILGSAEWLTSIETKQKSTRVPRFDGPVAVDPRMENSTSSSMLSSRDIACLSSPAMCPILSIALHHTHLASVIDSLIDSSLTSLMKYN